jgi:hypothetical protein
MDPTASAAGDWVENLNLNPPADHFSSSKMTKRHAAQSPALRERFLHSSFVTRHSNTS